MQNVQVEFEMSFDPKADCDGEYKTIEKFFHFFYIKLLSDDVSSTLRLCRKFTKPEDLALYDWDVSLKTADFLSDTISKTISYTPKLTAKGKPSKKYGVSFSFIYHDEHSEAAIKKYDINKFVHTLLISDIISSNNSWIDMVTGNPNIPDKNSQRFLGMATQYNKMLKQMQKSVTFTHD
jgi:hypothetical protein